MKGKSKIFALFMGVVLTLGSLAVFAGCGSNTDKIPENPLVEAPAPEYKVYSVGIQYNNSNVNGSLSVDLSAGTITLTAVVNKDEQADGTVTFASSVETVATVENTGVVTLKAAGETVISATAGNKTNKFVLVVGNSLASPRAYTLTVNGGKAYDRSGNAITSAREGDYVTLKAEIPEHKDFVEWQYGEDDLWVNGNTFKMPGHDMTVSAEYIDMLYTLNVIGAEVSKANGETDVDFEDGGFTDDGRALEYAINVYHIAFDTEIEVEAMKDPAGKIFVGWDYGSQDNRVTDPDERNFSFQMTDYTLTVWAIYSPIQTKVLTKAPSGFSGTSETTIDGLSGYRVNIAGNKGASTDNPENIGGSQVDSVTTGTQIAKAIFVNNHATLDVTVELYVSFYGVKASSGNVTIPAGETVEHYFTIPLGIPGSAGPWWGFQVRESIGGSSSDMIQLDMAVGAAPMYPKGDKQLSASGVAEYVELGSYTYQGWARECHTTNNNGSTYFAIYGANFTQGTNSRVYFPINNMPAYDAENPVTYIYVRAINLVTNETNPENGLKFVVASDPNDILTSEINAEIEFTKIGETFVLRLAVPRTANDRGLFYFGVVKSKIASTGTYWGQSFAMQLTYNNVMGYEEA